MIRKRAVAVVLHDNSLLVMYRKNPEGNEFFTFPGGGVEDSETVEDAVVREIDEECNIVVEPKNILFTLERENIDIHYFYLCDYIGGMLEVKAGTKEYEENLIGDNLHVPQWLPLSELEHTTLYPEEAKQKLIEYLASEKRNTQL